MLLASSLVITSCLKEPSVDFCVVLHDKNLHCFPSDKKIKEYEIEESVGYICVSPDHYGEIKKHHQDLHDEIKGN